MNHNNRGFAISSVMYLILVLAITLVVLTLSIFANRRLILNFQKESVMEDIYGKKLPDGYTRLLYIEGTGTQYINTGVELDSSTNSKLLLDIEFVDGSSTNYVGANCFLKLHYDATKKVITIDELGPSNTESQISFSDRGIIRIEQNNKKISLYAKGQSNTKEWGEGVCDTSSTLFLFAFGKNGGLLYDNSTIVSAKIYSAKVYKDNDLKRDFVPCSYNGAIGMYDLVTKNFYGNAGTGKFTS